jgi:UDP-glucose 4-epimerase
MKCLVFGGGGFIGSAITDHLLSDGHSIRIFERPRVEPYRQFCPPESVEWIGADFLNSHDLRVAIRGVDVIIHLISTTLPKISNEDPIYDVHTNVIATLQLLNEMVTAGIRRILFISSGGTVYGSPRTTPIKESHPTNPEVSYGITKLAIEKYLYLYSRLHNLRPTILRVANPYGERQRIETAQGAAAAFIHRVLSNKPIEIWGDGSVVRDYIHVSDVARAFALALRYSGEEMIFNISTGVGTTLNDLILIMESLIGRPVDRKYITGRNFDVPVSVLDNSLAKAELGWAPNVTLVDGLRATIEWAAQEMAHKAG